MSSGVIEEMKVRMRIAWRPLSFVPLLLLVALSANAQGAPNGEADPGFFESWFDLVSKTQAEQPQWITPLTTTTPRLEEEFRNDIHWQSKSDGTTTVNYGNSKGLELIPLEKWEVILSPPPYLVHNKPGISDGFGDFSFLLKYRFLAASEEGGNYILTAFLGVSLPTGSGTNGSPAAIITPTLAYGKGFRNFDVQGTFGVGLPAHDTQLIGRTYGWNNAFQYHVSRYFWPEIEVNAAFFQDGKNDGKSQVFLTPGLVIGRIHLWRRLGLTAGGGIQIAATHFHTSNHNPIFSIRFPF